jgi:Lipopolysaccharide-assembly
MRFLAAITTSTLLVTGCAHYQVGNESLYAPDIATVYVPMIVSDSYRPDLGERLTEAVIKEIELKTPYKVVGTPDADSILAVKLMGDSRHVLGEDSFDDPRLSESTVYSEVSWLNRRRLPMAPTQTLALPPELIDMDRTALLVPEAGQSVASSQQQAIERLAQQIVGTMETPW